MYPSYIAGMNFDTDHDSLFDKGVTVIEKIPYPHVFDLEDIRQKKINRSPVCIYSCKYR